MPIKNHYLYRRGAYQFLPGERTRPGVQRLAPRRPHKVRCHRRGRQWLHARRVCSPEMASCLHIRVSRELAPPEEKQWAYQFLSGERTRPRVQRLAPRRPRKVRCHRRGRRWLHARRVCSPEMASCLYIRVSRELNSPEESYAGCDSAGTTRFALLDFLQSSSCTGGQYAF
jgi:hypothetical protein